VQLGAFLQCGSAITLGIVTAAATNRMCSLGACGIGIRIAFFGGSLAAFLSLLEAGVVWILAQPGIADPSMHGPSVVRALYLFAFMLDGPAYAGSLGLLLAGISVAGLLPRLLPRGLAWVGLVVAARAELPLDACARLRNAHPADALPGLPVVDHCRLHALSHDAHPFTEPGVRDAMLVSRRFPASVRVGCEGPGSRIEVNP
jgi:hypothetical protein